MHVVRNTIEQVRGLEFPGCACLTRSCAFSLALSIFSPSSCAEILIQNLLQTLFILQIPLSPDWFSALPCVLPQDPIPT